MKYKFSDILNEEIYSECNFAFITGRDYIFINMIIDTFKEINTLNAVEETSEIASDFGLGSSDWQISNVVDIDTFRDVINSPSINGKWFCVCDYKTLNKKQKGYIEIYMRNTSNNGILLVYSTDYREYRNFLNNVVLTSSRKAHLISLNFVHKATLKTIIRQLFLNKGKDIESNALEYLIMKMGKAYDDMDKLVDSMIEETSQLKITILDAKRALKGVENFTIDDFIVELTKPLSNDKTNNKKIYRMMAAMIDQYGARQLINVLAKEVRTMIEFRRYINCGTIPITISYIYNDAIREIESKSYISKIAEPTFRRKALIAAQTSLEDWTYMRMILSFDSEIYSDDVCYRALYGLVTRTTLSSDRINNIIGITDVIDRAYRTVDANKYKERQVKTEETE